MSLEQLFESRAGRTFKWGGGGGGGGRVWAPRGRLFHSLALCYILLQSQIETRLCFNSTKNATHSHNKVLPALIGSALSPVLSPSKMEEGGGDGGNRGSALFSKRGRNSTYL